MRAVLVLALVLAIATAAPGREKPRSPAPTEVSGQTLDALAAQYLDAGLPLPPPGVPPALVRVAGNPAVYTVGFRIGPGADGERPGRFLVGTETGEPRTDNAPGPAVLPLDPARGLPAGVRLSGGWINDPALFQVDAWLALAAQCRLRGYDRLARQACARGLARPDPGVRRFTQPGDGSLWEMLAATAWSHWLNVQCTPGSDRREILVRLERLAAKFPFLDGPVQRDYLESLRLTTVPGTGAAGSTEALVDALIEHFGSSETGQPDSNDPNYAGLWERGFAAVPVLIAHLDDRRLTRSATISMDDGLCYPRRVNEVVSDLIETIAGAGEFPHGSCGRPEGQPADREAVARWWTKASAIGEEVYMTSHVFPPSWVSLRIVAERYPRRLEEIYARMLREQPGSSCDEILRIIVSWAHLSSEERRRLLHMGIASPDLARSLEALGQLSVTDPADADSAMVEKLGHWPTDLTGPYGGPHPEAEVSHFVMFTDSAAVWEAYEQALRRASPALRIEMLTRLADDLGKSPLEARRLALLGRFLDDADVRVIRPEDEAPGGRFEGYGATPATRRLHVGNMAAWLIGARLGIAPLSGAMQAHGERWWAGRRAIARKAVDRHTRGPADGR